MFPIKMGALSSPIIAPTSLPFPSHRSFGGPHFPAKPRAVRFSPASAKEDSSGSDFGGWLVDQDMIVLRKRIHDMEVAEHNYEAPAHWAEWEKRYYASYGSDVCEFVGLVQTLLLNTRPGLAIGLAGLMAISVPTSGVLIWIHFFKAMRTGILGE